MEKKQIRLFYTTKEFEEFVNHETVEVIDIQIKAMENSAMFQESFFAIVFYKDAVTTPSESSDKGAEDNIVDFLLGSSSYNGSWFNLNVIPEGKQGLYWWRNHLNEHLALKEKEAHNAAVDKFRSFCKDWFENERALEGKDFYTELEKLKR